MRTLLQDLRYGVRLLVKQPGFTLVAVLTLALGIGATTAVFSVVNGMLLRPLPYPAPEQLVAVREARVPQQPDAQIAPGNFLEWQRQNTVFAALAAYRNVSYNLTGDGGEPERLLAGRASAGLFQTLGVRPLLGRDFAPEEDEPGREKVVLISHGLWQRRFGADANVVGRTLRLSGENFTVIGVLPPGFRLPDLWERELWTPLAFTNIERELHHARYVEAIGRLKDGVTLRQAQGEMNTLAARLAEAYPDADAGWDVRLTPLVDFVVGDAKAVLWLLGGAVAFVLLIACANVANLLLARAATRQKEMAIRAALGAGRLRIVRQLLTESLLLAALGSVGGWLLAMWGLEALLALAPPDLPRIGAVTIDGRAFLFTLAVTLLAGLAFGLAPAWQLSRPDLNRALKATGAEGKRGAHRLRLGDLLVVGEVALALALLTGGGLLLRTLWQLRRVEPGFDHRNALAVTLQLSEKRYAKDEQINLFSQQLLRRVAALPGVQRAAVTRVMPIIHDFPVGFYVEGRPHEQENQLPQTNYAAVSPAYFGAMGIPLLKGRAFTDGDRPDTPRVAVISATMAESLFPHEDPIGKRISLKTSTDAWREIVGVVGDVKQNGLNRPTRPQAYEPFAQAPNQFMTLVVRADANPAALVPAIRRQVSELDAEQPLHSVRTLDALVANSIRQQRFTAWLLSVFALAALVLAAAGLYGLLSYSVTQRTRELGIRLALGAQASDVLRLVVGQGIRLTLVGIAVGFACAAALTRLMTSLLYGVKPTDPLTFAVVALVLAVVAALACYLPARRATKVDPLVALRYE